MYMGILETHEGIFKLVLQHVKKHPDRPFLFHCTAGKDRTGVLAYLLHSLAGSPTDVINLDYALTRVGVEPVREFLMSKLVHEEHAPFRRW
jgi:protein tyrosine/serine phosphatase